MEIIKNLFSKEVEKNDIKFLDGSVNIKDEIAPSYINMKNPKYIEIDNLFFSGLIVVNYYREQEDLILKSLIERIYLCFMKSKINILL